MIVDVWRRFRAQRGAVAALYSLIVIVALSLLAPLIAPQDPSDPLGFDPLAANHPPTLSWAYLFGADSRGRDVLSLLLWGGRTTLSIGVGAAILAALVGAGLGALACWRGGVFDPLLSRLMDVCGAAPPLLVLLLLASRLGGAPAAVMLAVFALSGWVVPARLTRTTVRAGLAAPYVEAARAMGVTGSRLLFVHLLPAALPPVAAWTAAAASAYVALEAGLDFLGLGLPAGTTSWGTALAGAQAAVSAGNWWWMTFGGIALAVSTLALAGVARGVARALDPTMPVMSIARGHTAITFALDAAGPQSENRRGGRARLSPRAVVGGGLGGAIPPGSPWARWTAGRSRGASQPSRWTAGRSRGASQPWTEGGIGNDATIARLRAVWGAPRKETALSSDRTTPSWRRRWTRPIAAIGAALLLVTVIGVTARSHDMRHAPRPAALLNNAAAYPTQRGQRAAYIATATYAVVEGIDPSTRGLPWAAYDSCPAPLMGKRCARADVQLWFGAGQGRVQSEGSTYICTPRLTWGLNPMAGLATTVRTPCGPLGPAMVGLGATAGVAQRLLPAITRGARDDARLTGRDSVAGRLCWALALSGGGQVCVDAASGLALRVERLDRSGHPVALFLVTGVSYGLDLAPQIFANPIPGGRGPLVNGLSQPLLDIQSADDVALFTALVPRSIPPGLVAQTPTYDSFYDQTRGYAPQDRVRQAYADRQGRIALTLIETLPGSAWDVTPPRDEARVVMRDGLRLLEWAPAGSAPALVRVEGDGTAALVSSHTLPLRALEQIAAGLR